MSPADKRRIVFTAAALLLLALFFFVLSFVPSYLYGLLCVLCLCGACVYGAEECGVFENTGLGPRRRLSVPPALLRCLRGAGHDNILENKSDARNSLASPGNRHLSGFTHRRETTFSEFSPRDLLMGSYLSRPESPSGAGRPATGSGAHVHPGRQLRERLTRPNHGALTPTRRLSFGDPVAGGRFTVTPQRHYPLQQTGTSSVGVLPPAQWDGFRKKNILTQRNTPIRSPVTVKISRPDNPARSPFFDQLNSPGALTSTGFGVQGDPCSRETVLGMLRESRKRDVDDADKGHAAGLNSKRRRHDSSGSSQSAFEPFLANGAPSQLVPKPGSLKRGLNSSMLEESTMKRSRTSSISSVSGATASCGVPGSVRNPIRSSYSSSQGYPQRRVASSLNLSPLTSPGSSRCQTPERAAKKPREEDAASPSSVSSIKSDKTATDRTPGSGKHSPVPDAPVTSASDSGGISGKRKRKIQLVSTRRGDQISLPPPPELAYTITVKDLDMEKKAALSQIQKVLEEPEPEKPAPEPAPAPASTPSTSLFSQLQAPVFSNKTTSVVNAPSLASLTTPPAVPTSASTAVSITAQVPASAPTIDLTVTQASTASALTPTTSPPVTTTTSAAPAPVLANPLLESLKNMKNNPLLGTLSPLAATSAALAAPVLVQTPAPSASISLSTGSVKSEPALVAPRPTITTLPAPATQPTTSLPSAFAQILAQPLQPRESSLFSTGSAAKPAPAAPTLILSTGSTAPRVAASTTAGPAPSVFKPIFGAATTAPTSAAEVKSTQPTFKPIFGSPAGSGPSAFGQPTTSAQTAPATQSAKSVFGSLTSSQPAAVSVASSTPATQTPGQSLFGSWGTTSAAPVPAVNSTFQFGASSTPTASGLSTNTTTSSSSTKSFQFGALKPAQTAAPAAPQSTFTFGQTPAVQNSTTTPFGGFGMASNIITTTASAPTTQATFGSSFSTSTFSNAPAAAKPFTFNSNSGSSASAPFAFGATTSTAAPTFGTTSQPTFGSTLAGFSFGNTTTPSVAPAFGATTQTAAPVPAPTFTFGAAPATPLNSAQSAPAPASGGFNFTASLSGAQFGTPGPAAQTSGFSFGTNNADSKTAFGTSTPAFGTGSGPIPFGSPGTPVQGFGTPPFGTSPATFSIGVGSKPTGTRQRLQARRQHVRKK
ncbi:nuclear envelope pore membrane protein POM 121 [Hoplias malabaricus]|uniref:nuclear envelope pore membrane protein POM 121 n=1 Tax=Hoplias malabaricus TaxID=27720 RepID=UPI003461B442